MDEIIRMLYRAALNKLVEQEDEAVMQLVAVLDAQKIIDEGLDTDERSVATDGK